MRINDIDDDNDNDNNNNNNRPTATELAIGDTLYHNLVTQTEKLERTLDELKTANPGATTAIVLLQKNIDDNKRLIAKYEDMIDKDDGDEIIDTIDTI